MSNVEFSYLYRDGGNCKNRGTVVFSNSGEISVGAAEGDLRQHFLEDGLFIASQIRVPEVFLFAGGRFSSDDHCYHEFDGIRSTTRSADDTLHRSIGEFLAEVDREAHRGWRLFDPYDSKGSYGFLLASRVL
jgi:hypothetical protein